MTESKPNVHILETKGHNLSYFFLVYMPDPLHNIGLHYPLTEYPIVRYLHVCIFCVSVFLFLFLSIWLILRLWPFMVWFPTVFYYDFNFCGFWLFILLRDTGIGLNLFCAFWLQLGCWISPHGPCCLGSVQTAASTTDMSCFYHFNDYSSDGKLQCHLIIIKLLPQLLSWAVTCIYLMQGNCLHLIPTSSATQWKITDLFCGL